MLHGTCNQWELQIKTAMRGHYKPIRMANIQTLTSNAGKDVKQQELSFISILD